MTAFETLVYTGYVSAATIARALPQAAVPTVSRGIGTVAARTMRRRRALMARHLIRVRGSMPRHALNRAVVMAFQSYARYWLEASRLGPTSDLDRGFEVEGLDRLDQALEARRGAVLALPHLGNWDLGGAWLTAHGYPLTTVVEPLSPPSLLEWFARRRRALGFELIEHDNVIERLTRVLRDNRIVALLCDRDLGRRGVTVNFFGETTTLPAGPARLARETGAALLPTAVYFGSGERHRAVVAEEIRVGATDRPREDIARVTQAMAFALEQLIAAAPEQWHLMQPNWPSDLDHR